MEFKDKLAIQRKKNNYSQEQLADMVGVSRQSVSKWETGESYPDMAKIIQLCKILNCELTDLLDDGVLSEANVNKNNADKQSKGKQLIDYFNGFLDFVTKTYNMFVHMTFKSKIVMLIELTLLGLFIVLVVAAISGAVISMLNPLLYLVPDGAYYIVRRIVLNIIISIVSIIGIIVFIHLFKIRYLDYYVTITDNKVKSQSVEEPIEDNINRSGLVQSASPKIVIRDPEHSSSKFIEMLANIAIVLFKIFVVICALPAIVAFVALVAGAGLSMVNISPGNGMVFLYALMVFVGCAALCYILIHFAYNIIFGRKQPLKMFLIVLICSLLLTGMGSGLVVDKLSTFTSEAKQFKTETIKIEESDEPLYLSFWTPEVEYVIKEETRGIIIEATVPEEYRTVLSCWDSETNVETGESTGIIYNVYSYLDYNGPFDALGSVIKHLKEGSVMDFDEPRNVGKVKVTLSQDMMNKLMH